MAIDPNLQKENFRPDNAYSFIERKITVRPTCSSSTTLMTHSTHNTYKSELKSLHMKVDEQADQMHKLTLDLNFMKQKLEKTKQDLSSTRHALRDITNELAVSKKQHHYSTQQVLQWKRLYESTKSDYVLMENELEQYANQNAELYSAFSSAERELTTLFDAETVKVDEKTMTFTFQTTVGATKYSPAVRKLYYTLLANQTPPAKIVNIIKAVLKCFLPNLDTAQLILPKEKCAGYMRREELKTISMAHKASIMDTIVEEGMLHMNTDGTTKFQKKLGSTAVNGTVLAVNEIPDGTAESIIRDISKELQKLREIAQDLNLPHANQINWTLLASSTSDSASAQKKLNKLIEQQKEADHKTFGSATHEAISIVENFCAMHLGTNLRKAFLDGIRSIHNQPCENGQRDYHTVDVLVHEFCKLFGKHGVPEYGCGMLTFPDFLALKLEDSSLNSNSELYYSSCASITLERQVGSRYFVSAANATKILFLTKAALEFLEFTGKNQGTKLEKVVYCKLQDANILLQLKADALMFYHVYADLVMLAKSNSLDKNVFSMNQHYMELDVFLEEIEKDPEVAMNKDYNVFRSEERLYGNDKATNHRLHVKSQSYHKCIFERDELDSELFQLLCAGARTMKAKLCSYAKNQLPNGKYWNPNEKIKAILEKLKPSNDICESILGLNDYLCTALPNLSQMTRSNLVEIKKNKTIPWFEQQPEDRQNEIIDMACKRRATVLKEFKEEEQEQGRKRREHMLVEKQKRDVLHERLKKEQDKLSKIHLITSPNELTEALVAIDKKSISKSKKKQEKLTLLKTQIKIRKKVLNQKIHIVFSHCHKQRPIQEIAKDLSVVIAKHDCPITKYVRNPSLLVGCQIKHKFEIPESGEETWFYGSVMAYDSTKKLHEINYDDEQEHSYFDLTQDLIMGDLIIIL